jgi:GTP diphosphokinase / guanosine-3',5'-bis(diphosphate) 3'-diphosphatase
VTLTLGRYATDDNAPAQGVVFIDGSEGATVQLAPCCRPIPGDAIVGYLGRGEGLLVHTATATSASACSSATASAGCRWNGPRS